MSGLLFGIIDRIHPSTSAGPRARLKPLWEASKDKSRWQPLDEDFPNSGLVSWWQPPSDLTLHSAWSFQTEESPSYDPNKPQHDYFRVRGVPSVPIELVDLEQPSDEEELREYLLQTGIPASLCNSRRVVVRQCSGSLVGPIDLVLRNGRYYADEKQFDQPIALSQPRSDLSLAETSNHRFLPLEGWSTRIAELDFSSNELFLKRVVKDLKKITPSIVDDVKLTDKLITRYCAAVGTASLSPAQRYRLLRLQRIATHSRQDIQLSAEALTDFLSIGTIAELLDQTKTKVREETIASTQASLSTLHEQRQRLDHEVARLTIAISQNKLELASLERQHASTLEQFDAQAKERFRNLSTSASGFLTEIALIRAALDLQIPTSLADLPPRIAESVRQDTSDTLTATEFLNRNNQNFATQGLGCRTSCSLLSSVASGFFPIVFGPSGREALGALAHTLAADRLYWLPLHPTLTSPAQLRSELLLRDQGTTAPTTTLDGLLQAATASSDISILVLENINLAQIDSVLLPLIRQYVELRTDAPNSSDPPAHISTSVGVWPANLLLAGFAIDSPLSLPVSTELWSYATFVYSALEGSASSDHAVPPASPAPKASRLSYDTWIEWLKQMNAATTADPMMLAAYVAHKIEMSLLLKRLMRNLAAAIAVIAASKEPNDRLRLFAELTVVPYSLSRGKNPRSILEDCPTNAPVDPDIARIEAVFKRWGIDLTDSGAGAIANV
jgi:hypothetical protein